MKLTPVLLAAGLLATGAPTAAAAAPDRPAQHEPATICYILPFLPHCEQHDL